MEVLIFIAGQIIGGCIGFFTCALCVAAGAVCKLFNDGDIDLLAIQQEVYEKTGVKVGVE